MKLVALIVALFGATLLPAAETEDRDFWYRREAETLEKIKKQEPITGPAKNIILFVGDGMGISTVTAARILAGQGQPNNRGGEEYQLEMEKLPYSAFSKTYSVNQQTCDSAPSMTAIITGVKTKDKVLSVDPSVIPGDHRSVSASNKLPTILHLAKQRGKSVGIVTTTRLTHATPAACYGHTPDRAWECDADLKADNKAAYEAGFPDLARQLIEFPQRNPGLSQLNVALGGGHSKFLPANAPDPQRRGSRLDGRDLTAEWLEKNERAAVVTSKTELNRIDPAEVDHLLGLFAPEHMQYDAFRDRAKEPSLTEMTRTALQVLKKNPRGFFLMVEGGRIDHGHHGGNPYRALTDTVAFDQAIKFAVEHTDEQETLIIVTADHSHVFTLGSYAQRGNPILGLVRVPDGNGAPTTKPVLDMTGKPYTSVGYANGPGYPGASQVVQSDGTVIDVPAGPKSFPHYPRRYFGVANGRPHLTDSITQHPDYLPESSIPLSSESHGGEDVPIFAGGPNAHYLRGVREQNFIFHVMKDALGEAEEPSRSSP